MLSRVAQLQRLASAFVRARSTREVAALIARAGGELLGAQRVTLAMRAADGSLGIVAGADDPELPLAAVLASGEPAFLPAALVVSLPGNDGPLGVIGFGFDAPRSFDADERTLIQSLVDQSALVLEKARLDEAERVAHGETEVLLALAERANRATTAGEIYQPALEAVCRLVGIERASVLLFDDAGVMQFVAWRDLSDAYRAAVAGHSPWTRDTRDPEPVLVADVLADPHLAGFEAVFRAQGIRSLGFVPLVQSGELLGKFMLYAAAPRRFTEREIHLAEAVAAQVAQAVGRSRLIERERAARAVAERAAEQTRRLQRVTARLSTALVAREIAEIVLVEGSAALDAFSGAMWLLRPERDVLELVGAHNYPEAVVPQVSTLPVDAGRPLSDAVLRGEPIWLTSKEDYGARYPESAARTRGVSPDGATAIGCLPLSLEGAVQGSIAFTFSERVVDEDERRFAELLAQHCAQALERARLYEAAQAAQRRAAFLAEASAVLAASVEYPTTLQTVARLAVPRMADWCAVDVLDPVTGEMKLAVAHVDPRKVELANELRHRWPPDPTATTGSYEVMRTGRAEVYRHVTREMIDAIPDPELRDAIEQIGMGSYMIVPIRAHGESMGTITFINDRGGRVFGPEDVAMAEQLGERAGMAISNSRLFGSQRAAIAVRDDFLSIAGHELKTPLTALLLQAQSLHRGLDPARATDRAERLVRQAIRLDKLIDELLDVSRITSGRLTLEREEVDLGAIVVETIGRMADDAARVGSEIRFAAAPPLRGHWDRFRIEQVVTNVVSNAIKYGQGHPIDVRTEAGGGRAVLTVRDRGIGIAPEDHARIFGRFERAASSRHFGGFGLGLWIVRQIVEAHGGAIAVDSTPGEGAEFRIELPVRGSVS